LRLTFIKLKSADKAAQQKMSSRQFALIDILILFLILFINGWSSHWRL